LVEKSRFLTYPTSIYYPLEFVETFGVRKLDFRVHVLSYDVVCVILRLAVLVELQLLTNRRTDRRTHNHSVAQ